MPEDLAPISPRCLCCLRLMALTGEVAFDRRSSTLANRSRLVERYGIPNLVYSFGTSSERLGSVPAEVRFVYYHVWKLVLITIATEL